MPRSRLIMMGILCAVLFLFPVSTNGFANSSSNQNQQTSQANLVQIAPLIFRAAPNEACSPSSICPSMMDKAYGFDQLHSAGINGSGQTVIIDDACGDPTIASDLKTFDKQYHLNNPVLNVIYPQGKKNLCVDSGWSVETSLDVEWSHVVAPAAKIDLLVANQPAPANMYGAWTYALDHNLGDQISNSYGGAGCGAKCNNTIGQGIGPCTTISGVNVGKIVHEAAEKNVTILASAGDSGAWGKGTSGTEPIPGDCMGVLTVGGTTISLTSTGKYLGEAAWGATGGGYVTFPKEPTYQASVKIKDPYHTLAKPDVAAVGGTAVWIYNGGWGTVEGTSLSCPLWAGFIALVNQIRSKNGFAPAGFVAPFLYTVVYGISGNSTLYHQDFHDIKTGSNGWPAGKGWDADTGLGTFIAPALANTLGSNKSA